MFKFWYDATMLSFEAQRVIGLRMMKLAGGGKNAQAEANRMVMEKIAASMSIAATLTEWRFRPRCRRASPQESSLELAPPVRGNNRPTRRLRLMSKSRQYSVCRR